MTSNVSKITWHILRQKKKLISKYFIEEKKRLHFVKFTYLIQLLLYKTYVHYLLPFLYSPISSSYHPRLKYDILEICACMSICARSLVCLSDYICILIEKKHTHTRRNNWSVVVYLKKKEKLLEFVFRVL